MWYNNYRVDGDTVNGKVLKVKQNNLEFGSRDRYVNILGCFRYKINGNIYVVYSDVEARYNIIYYGSGHVRMGQVLCMPCRDKGVEEEVIKEYIFKMLQGESIDNFELVSLEGVDNIEIINSTKLEVKPEVLTGLIDIMLPKKVEVVEEELKEKVAAAPKNRSSIKSILIVFIVAFLLGGYYYLFGMTSKDTVQKSITCSKKYQHTELNAMVEETNKYNFDIRDMLMSVDTTMMYQFDETSYQDFIMRGTYYRYMPSDTEGGWSKDDYEYNFTVITKEKVDTSYSEPTNYEDILSYYKSMGYTCIEKIENE